QLAQTTALIATTATLLHSRRRRKSPRHTWCTAALAEPRYLARVRRALMGVTETLHRRSHNKRTALPRCERAFFSSGVNCAAVQPSPGTRNSGSYPKPPLPLAMVAIDPSKVARASATIAPSGSATHTAQA